MSSTDIPCEPHIHADWCGGFYTETEVKMAEMDTSRTVQEYHETLALFEEAFEAIFKAKYGVDFK